MYHVSESSLFSFITLLTIYNLFLFIYLFLPFLTVFRSEYPHSSGGFSFELGVSIIFLKIYLFNYILTFVIKRTAQTQGLSQRSEANPHSELALTDSIVCTEYFF